MQRGRKYLAPVHLLFTELYWAIRPEMQLFKGVLFKWIFLAFGRDWERFLQTANDESNEPQLWTGVYQENGLKNWFSYTENG